MDYTAFATENARREFAQPPQQTFYYVIEHATGIVRAAQSTLANALTYTTPQNCHLFIIAGPMTADELHKGRWTHSPKAAIDSVSAQV